MTDRLDELLFSIGEEENGGVDFDQMYADLLQKQREEEKKRSTRRSRFVRYGAMAASAVALIGIGAAMLSGSRLDAAPIILTPSSDESAEEAPAMAEAPDETAATGSEAYNGEAYDPEAATPKAKLTSGLEDTAVYETVDIGTCEDAKQRLKAAGISAEPYEGYDAPEAGCALITGDGEAIWNAGGGVYKITLTGDIAAQLRALCE